MLFKYQEEMGKYMYDLGRGVGIEDEEEEGKMKLD
jgi:hypothetical protein